MTIKTLLQTVLATILMVAIFENASHAQIINWTNSGGGFFDVGTNWSTGTAPGTSASATFSIPGIYDVDWDGFTGDVTTNDLFVLNGDVSFRSLGSGAGGTVYTYTVDDDLTVGIGATLRIGDGFDGMNLIVGDQMLVDAAEMRSSRNGSLTALGTIDIGSSNNASGFLNLQETQFDAMGMIRAGVGDNAQGRIVAADETIANTTNVDIGVSATGNGNLEVIGENTVWNSTSELDIGYSGRGVMEVRLGATVNSLVSAVGWLSGGDGDVTVRHTGSTWNIDNRLDIGGSFGAVGTLLLEDGGSVSVFGTDLTIGAFTDLSGCEFTARDPGSVMFVARDIYVGGTSDGLLNVENEANVLAQGGIFIRSLGTVNVGGFITQGLTGATMQLEGTMNLSDSSHVNIANTLDIDTTGVVNTAGSGIPILQGGSINNSGRITMDASTDIFGDFVNDGIIDSLGTSFNIFYDDFINNGIINAAAGSITRIEGTASGIGSYAGDGTIEFLGAVRPGVATGTGATSDISIGGDLIMTDTSSLEIELGGTGLSQFDWIALDENLTLFNNPTLVVSSLGSFTPSSGDEFIIIKICGTRTGEFNSLAQGDLVTNLNGQDLFIDYTAGDGNDIALTTSSVGGFLLGDVNLDGAVNLLDVEPFINLISSGLFQIEADINMDGVVNLLDVDPFIDVLVGS